MKHTRALVWAAGLGAFAVPAAANYSSGYTYVKMSLTVPWTLYFVFLACVLIPFVLMIVLAWRKPPKSGSATKDAAVAESARPRP